MADLFDIARSRLPSLSTVTSRVHYYCSAGGWQKARTAKWLVGGLGLVWSISQFRSGWVGERQRLSTAVGLSPVQAPTVSCLPDQP